MSGSRFLQHKRKRRLLLTLPDLVFIFLLPRKTASFIWKGQAETTVTAVSLQISRCAFAQFLSVDSLTFSPFFSLWCTCISINSCRLGIWQERRCLRRAYNTAAAHTSAFYSCPNTTRRGKFGSDVCARFCLRVLAVMRLNKITNKRKIQRKNRANTQMAHEFVSVLRRSGCDCDGTVLLLLMCCAAANPTKVIHTDTKQLSCQSLETTAQIPGRALPCS